MTGRSSRTFGGIARLSGRKEEGGMMPDFSGMGRILIVIGLVIAGIGLAVVFAGKIPWLGRLPGDFFFRGKGFSFYFPLTTSIVISVILTLILWFINRR